MSDETAFAPEVEAPAAPARAERPSSFDSVADAVRELEVRESERRAQTKAAKAAQAQKLDPVDDDNADDDEDDRTPRNEDEDKRDEAKRKARAKQDDDEDSDDEDSDDESSDDDGDVATDDDEDDEPQQKRKTQAEDPSLDEVEYEGKKYRVAPELKNALLRQSDYTRKTQEVAEYERQVSARYQETEATIAQVQRAQAAVLQMAEQIVGSPPPIELAQTDPQQYVTQKALYEARLGQVQELMGHTNQLTARQQQAQEQQRIQRLQSEAQQMVRLMPPLADPGNRKIFLEEAARAAEISGFSAEEVGAIDDHRMLHLMARLVMLERREAARSQASGSVKQKLANVPPKLGKPGSANPDAGRSAKAARAKSEFMKSSKTLRDVQRYLRATET